MEGKRDGGLGHGGHGRRRKTGTELNAFKHTNLFSRFINVK